LGDDGRVDVRLLVVADCANEGPAAAVVRQALERAGLADLEFRTVVVRDEREAAELGFTGSPTVLVDGRDPFADEGAPPALACRLYRTGSAPGTPAGPATSGVPPLAGLVEALRRAAASESDAHGVL
jgi:hypothetical protein